MTFIRKNLGVLIKKYFYKPPYVNSSAQTIYKTLQGCLKLAEFTKEKYWSDQAEKLTSKLISKQNNDGGFDVGYNYPYGEGLIHSKGNSHSSETTAILALAESYRITPSFEKIQSLRNGAYWIIKNTRQLGNDLCAIPYDPYKSQEIIIINSTSFSASALGCSISFLGEKHEVKRIYYQMINFLDKAMSVEESIPGRFWYYYYQNSNINDSKFKYKVDYYHQMQQIEAHSISQKYLLNEQQLNIIRDGADHVASIHKSKGLIPYDNNDYFDGIIHTWGISSVIPGFIEAAKVIPYRRDIYLQVARETMKWLMTNAWEGQYFYDLLYPDGRIVSTDYMVRSDAYCFYALASYLSEFGHSNLYDIAEISYKKMEKCDFSGHEKHGQSYMRTFLQKFEKSENYK